MDLNHNRNIIIKNFGNDFVQTNDNINPHLMYNCPFCESKRGKIDDDRKLYVSIPKLKFYCFKCHSKGSLASEDFNDSNEVYDNLINLNSLNTTDEDDENNMFYFRDLEIPKTSKAYEYLISRGIDDEKIDFYNIKFGIDRLYGRIVIPNIIYAKNWTDMYQARSYINQIPKYLNPADSNKSQSVFNLHNLKEGGEVNVVEGAITAICGGNNCIGLYGSSPSNKQLTDIVNHNFEEINCVLDYDESGIKGNEKLAEELSLRCKSGTKINIINMPKGIDAADMGEKKFKKYIQNNKIEYISRDNVYTKLLELEGEIK